VRILSCRACGMPISTKSWPECGIPSFVLPLVMPPSPLPTPLRFSRLVAQISYLLSSPPPGANRLAVVGAVGVPQTPQVAWTSTWLKALNSAVRPASLHQNVPGWSHPRFRGGASRHDPRPALYLRPCQTGRTRLWQSGPCILPQMARQTSTPEAPVGVGATGRVVAPGRVVALGAAAVWRQVGTRRWITRDRSATTARTLSSRMCERRCDFSRRAWRASRSPSSIIMRAGMQPLLQAHPHPRLGPVTAPNREPGALHAVHRRLS
jgi:hypothetical protein